MKIAALGLLFLLSACTTGGLTTRPAILQNPHGVGMPAEVSDFMDRREACAHFSNEDPYDSDRADFLRDQAAMYCTGSDAELTRLRQTYAANPDVLERLDNLERDLGNTP